MPDENALPTAKAKKHGSKRHYARRGFPFRFALKSSEDSEFTIVSLALAVSRINADNRDLIVGATLYRGGKFDRGTRAARKRAQ